MIPRIRIFAASGPRSNAKSDRRPMPFRSMSLLIAGLLGLASLPCSAYAAAPAQPATRPTSQSTHDTLSPARVKAALADYTRWLDTLQQRHEVAGLATAVVYGDKVIYEHTSGYADAATGSKVTPTTVFRLASLSKAFATATAGLLIDDGRFSWNTKLIDVLPFFKLKDAQASSAATVGDILGQRIGLQRDASRAIVSTDSKPSNTPLPPTLPENSFLAPHRPISRQFAEERPIRACFLGMTPCWCDALLALTLPAPLHPLLHRVQLPCLL